MSANTVIDFEMEAAYCTLRFEHHMDSIVVNVHEVKGHDITTLGCIRIETLKHMLEMFESENQEKRG